MRYADAGYMGIVLAIIIVGTALTVGIYAGAGSLPVIDGNGLSWDTSAATNYWRQRADLAKVRAVEETKRNADLMLTLQVMAVAGTVGGAVMVGVTQWGRTVRHRDTQRTEQVRLCMAYVAQHYLPGDDVEVRTLPGRGVVVVDHDAGEVVPVAVIEQTFQPPAVRRGGY